MTITPPQRATAVRHKALLPAAVLSASVAMLLAGAAHAEVVPSQFSSAALVKAPETVSCTLENGTQTQCTRLVVKYKPDGLKTGPFCPPSLDDEGGIWDWDGENSGLYRLDRAFFEMLDTLGFHFHDDDETLHIMTDLSKRPVEANNCLNVAEDESVEMTVLLPLEPVEADEPTPLGTVAKIGLALDGVPIFADAPSVLDTGNLPALDTCGGHVDPGGWYHWHATATDIDTLYDEHGVDAHCQLPQSHTAQFAYVRHPGVRRQRPDGPRQLQWSLRPDRAPPRGRVPLSRHRRVPESAQVPQGRGRQGQLRDHGQHGHRLAAHTGPGPRPGWSGWAGEGRV